MKKGAHQSHAEAPPRGVISSPRGVPGRTPSQCPRGPARGLREQGLSPTRPFLSVEFLWEAGTGGARALELEGSNLSCVSQASYFTSLGLHVCLCRRGAIGPQVIVGIQGGDAFGDAGTCTGSGSASGSWTMAQQGSPWDRPGLAIPSGPRWSPWEIPPPLWAPQG